MINSKEERPRKSPWEAEDLSEFFDTDFLGTEEKKPPTPVKKEPFERIIRRIQDSVKKTIEEMEPYRFSDQAHEIIRDFLTFHYQAEYYRASIPEVDQTNYNLMIRSDSRMPADHLVEVLKEQLGIQSLEQRTYAEADIIRMFDYTSRQTSRLRTNSSLIPDSCNFIYIHSCQAPPVLNSTEGTSASINEARKKLELYNSTWEAIYSHLKLHPSAILVTHTEDAVYRTGLQRNKLLFYQLCSNHIYIPPCTEEDLWQYCLRKLRATSFTMGEGFEDALRDYFEAVYPRAEIREYAFVDDLLRRIYALYLCSVRHENVLTPDCIPKYQSQVISPEDVLGQLNAMVGLQSVKSQFRDIYKMQLMGLNDGEQNRYHMIFTGNPGTGKTTVAKMAAELFYRMGIIKTNRLVHTKSSELISQWVGGTGLKTAEVIRQAYDGVLFIDEAYGLADNKSGPEALNVLIQEMEEKADRLIVILAGYKHEMRELMDLNPGLTSRIGRTIEFEDYSVEELVQIFHNLCRRDGFTLEPEAEGSLVDCLNSRMTREYFGNAREASILLQRLKEAWSGEYFDQVAQENMDADDVPHVFAPRHFAQLLPEKREMGIRDLIGLTTLKEKLEQFKNQAAYQKRLREKNMRAFPDFSLHMLFTGNPGTGKTTVAKLIADDLYSIGVLKTNRLVVAGRKDLISSYVGETSHVVDKLIKRAVGGVLFIDEAYTLIPKGDNDHASEVVEALLTAMEDHKADTVFIFAGYVDEMQSFLDSNPGIRSRIGYTFHFEDYSTEELTQIFARSVNQASMTITPEALDKVRQIMEYFRSVKHFGNGRFAAHLFQQVILRRSGRDYSEQFRDIILEDIPDFKTLIETAPNGMSLYDPGKITKENQRRTAVHEIGHAIVAYRTDPEQPPEVISIRSQSQSLGRVRLSSGDMDMTEDRMLHRLAISLAGLYAEKAFFGNHTTGCSSDYAKTKRTADRMLNQYAMDTYGSTPEEIIKTAKELSQRIIGENIAVMEKCVAILMEKMELSTEEFVAMVKAHDEAEAKE